MDGLAKQFVLEVMSHEEGALANALNNGGSQELNAQFNLIGIGDTQAASVHLAMPCTGAAAGSVTCSSDIGIGHPLVASLDTCFQTSCEAAGVPALDVYITQPPHRDASDRTRISYGTSAPDPMGLVTYNPNPLTHWRYDASSPGVLAVSAALSQSAVVTLDDETAIDCSYIGTSSGTQSGGAMDYTVQLAFPHVLRSAPVSVQLHNNSNMPRTGTISVGNEIVASIAQTAVTWSGSCR